MLRTALLPLVAGFCLLAVPAPAQTPAPDSLAVAEVAELAPDSGPVAVPEPSAKAVRYYRSGNVLWIVSTVWSLLVLSALLFTGLSARIRTLAARVGRNWYLTIVAYVALFSALLWLIDLPLSYYTGFVRPHAYDLSNQTFEKWLGDSLKGLGVGILALALTLWIPYLLLRRSPRRWWLYTSLVAIPLTVLALLITPIWIEPLFNEFGPMQNRELESRILQLADRAGIEGGRVYEVNKSVDTKALNAYVTGFAGTKRIVLWDTLLERLSEPEVLFVMGHEMGHYVLRHTHWLIALNALLILFGLYATYRASGWVIARYRHRLGFDQFGDIASFPLLLLIFSLVGLVTAPVVNVVTRHYEHEADRFGLEVTRNNRAAASAFLKLQTENLAVPYPGPVYKLWRSSHPPLGERIEFANTYRPWEAGEPLRYERLIGK